MHPRSTARSSLIGLVRRVAAIGVAAPLVTLACGHEDPPRTPSAVPKSGSSVPWATSEEGALSPYLVADMNAREVGIRIPLGQAGQAGAIGVVVEGLRAVVGAGAPQVAAEETPESISTATPIPARFGGGFLFHTDHAVYRADTFAGPLRALARTPETIQAFSFAPKALLLRSRNGERFAIALPSGDRVSVSPPGVADVEGLEDGRALAFDDQGLAWTSSDFGAHWTEVTSALRSAPTRIANVRGELWLLEQAGTAQRLEQDGRLAAFDAAPDEEAKPLRKVDPRWRGTDTPLRTAFTLGAALDDRAALVYADGDIVRVDVRTGDLLSVAAGKLPPGATCRAVPTSNDVLFACVVSSAGSGSVSAFVASRGMTDAPVIEQSFAGEGRIAVSDDGGVVVEATCGGSSSSTPPQPPGAAVSPGALGAGGLTGALQGCVRQPDGTWRDVEVPSGVLPPGQTATVTRWIPRADGAVVALLEGAVNGIYDPQLGRVEVVPGALESSGDYYRPRRFRARPSGGDVVDASWTLLPNGAIRGYLARSGAIEIAPGGRSSRSPFALEVSPAGANALGRAEDGRLFQTTDHGASWTEVLAPPTGLGRSVHGCTSAGCDLGAFYRVGWPVRGPTREAARTKAKPAVDVRRTRAPEISCRPIAPPTVKVLARTALSPEDLGLGVSRLPLTPDNGETLLRVAMPRTIVHPVHDPAYADGDAPALRGVLSGFRTSREGDVLQSLGPVKALGLLRRSVSYVAPFDPAGAMRRGAILLGDVLAAGRAVGMSQDELTGEDPTESGNLVSVTPRDASLPSDLVLNNGRGVIALLRGGQDRARVVMRAPQNDGVVVSAAALPGDEIAMLEVEAGGPGRVFKVTSSGTSDLFEVGTNLGDALFYPANPDALAIGPRGEIALLRTGSGSEPASDLDPAMLLLPGSKPKPLAAWSTLRTSDDPACKADAGAFRTTLQLVGPWVRSKAPELRIEEAAPMIARVRWSESRVCLEGLEARVTAVTVRAPGETSTETLRQGTWIVGRAGQWARLGISEGIEWRQPLECTLSAPPP